MKPYVAYPDASVKRFRTTPVLSNSSAIPILAKQQQEQSLKPVKRRTKTGCLTCRRRRIKCDETKPFCVNCSKSNRKCEGYPNPSTTPQATESLSPPNVNINAALLPQQQASSSITNMNAAPIASGIHSSANADPTFNTSHQDFLPNEVNHSSITPNLTHFNQPPKQHPQSFPMTGYSNPIPSGYPQSNHQMQTPAPVSSASSNPYNYTTINPTSSNIMNSTYPSSSLRSAGSIASNLVTMPSPILEVSPFYFHYVVPSIVVFEFEDAIALHFWLNTVPQLAQSIPCINYSLLAFTAAKRLDNCNAYCCIVKALRTPIPNPNSFESLLAYALLAVSQLSLPNCDFNFVNNAFRKLSWSSAVRSNFVNTLLAMVIRESVLALLPRQNVWGFDGLCMSEVFNVRNNAAISDTLFREGIKILSQPLARGNVHLERIVSWRDEFHVPLYSNSSTVTFKALDCIGHALTRNSNDLLEALQILAQEDCSNSAITYSVYQCSMSLQNHFPRISKEAQVLFQVQGYYSRLLFNCFMECTEPDRPTLSISKSFDSNVNNSEIVQ
ncbi:transcription factor Moc3 [Schizosaccharomyces cryophilus OY26]|uniref:Transcription factor Moc3 n=1 Tax=Schizosaccharomyces cryophilus (strain OY26 / ATCC MYA-4695 / CBS 11777 / NBRC 106824 / NRRL Y48691) TaxID=653667 RepID=S9X127_SCHCR|nr:transcription factor Moc3 [Schizosaccharomyces cryophilus OY26]EPY50772.1 transcription factor Moc3 [Schizosaccharomyces cryophilus OY26]